MHTAHEEFGSDLRGGARLPAGQRTRGSAQRAVRQWAVGAEVASGRLAARYGSHERSLTRTRFDVN